MFIRKCVNSEWLEREGDSSLNCVRFCLWCWLKNEVYKRKVDTQHELLARILDAAACVKKRKDQFRRTTGDLLTRVAKCIEVDGGIFEHLLWVVTNLSFKSSVRMNIQLIVIEVSVLPFTVHIQTALTMNYNTASQNSDPAFWITLCRILIDRTKLQQLINAVKKNTRNRRYILSDTIITQAHTTYIMRWKFPAY
jgi:hypothetical protein